jgi:hypothetical protein
MGYPIKLPQWESIIKAHDSLPTNTIKLSKSTNLTNLSPFLGRWADPNDNECFIISEASNGSFKLEATSNETWRTVLKSINYNGLTLTFDEFFYTEPSDDYKTIITPKGHHPFSGVRNKIELALNPENPDELFITCSTFHMPNPIEDTLKKIQ